MNDNFNTDLSTTHSSKKDFYTYIKRNCLLLIVLIGYLVPGQTFQIRNAALI